MGKLPRKLALSRISLLSDFTDSPFGQERKCTSGCNAVCVALLIAKLCHAGLSSHKSHIPGFDGIIALVLITLDVLRGRR